MTRTTDNNYHFTPNTRLKSGEAVSKNGQSTDEPLHCTQSSHTTSSDTTSTNPSGRPPHKTKSPMRRPRIHKGKFALFPLISDLTKMTACCIYHCSFVITKIMPFPKLELHKAPCPKVSYDAISLPNPQRR